MMKKKGFVLAIVSVALAALTGAAVAFAWTSLWKTETNTIKIGQALEISIDGDAFDVDEIRPGETVSATFDIDLTDANFDTYTYALVMKGVTFTGEVYTYGESVAVWTYEFDSEGAAALTAAGGSFALTESGDVTLKLTLDEGVPVSFAGGVLTFILEIEATKIPV
jgi:hypothetical protein